MLFITSIGGIVSSNHDADQLIWCCFAYCEEVHYCITFFIENGSKNLSESVAGCKIHERKMDLADCIFCLTGPSVWCLSFSEVHCAAAKKVAIIGAGAAGLVTGYCLSDRQGKFDVTIFEQTSHVGGTWIYTETTGTDEYSLPIHSSMYKNLRTNLPKELMYFPGFPHLNELPSFIAHEDVRFYLERFSESLLQLIKVSLLSYLACVWWWRLLYYATSFLAHEYMKSTCSVYYLGVLNKFHGSFNMTHKL
jgi:Flavin-binding monooxygenase-like